MPHFTHELDYGTVTLTIGGSSHGFSFDEWLALSAEITEGIARTRRVACQAEWTTPDAIIDRENARTRDAYAAHNPPLDFSKPTTTTEGQ